MKFAIIPNQIGLGKDKMFDIMDDVVNRDHLVDTLYEVKGLFESKGDIIHTIDLYDDLFEVDYFLFFRLDWKWVDKIVKLGKGCRMVYCTAEPPSVDLHNTLNSYKRLAQIFPYILTWNDEWVDNISTFKRINPYYFNDERVGAYSYEDKRLITSISGDKISDFTGELYSERRRAISYFEENFSDEFDFYGTGWKKNEHISYGGRVDNKYAVFHKYKFAICYENISLPGYVTEKLYDCLVSGIVPIYLGAPNVSEYVPRDCYIDFSEFNDYDELAEFILKMSKDMYNKYLASADAFLNSNKTEVIGGKAYGNNIYDAIAHSKEDYKSSRYMRYYYLVWFAVYKRLKTYKSYNMKKIYKKSSHQ